MHGERQERRRTLPISVRLFVVCPSSLFDLLLVCSPFVSGSCLCPFCRLCLPLCASFGAATHILAFREPLFLIMNANRNMNQRQGREGDRTVRRQQKKGFKPKPECEIVNHTRRNLRERGGPGSAPFFSKKKRPPPASSTHRT